MQIPPLLAVQLLFRSKPELSSFAHVITTVSVFLDSSVELPLDEACKLESVALLQRIWDSCEIYTTNETIPDEREPIDQTPRRMDWGGFTMAKVAQSRRNDIVWWLNHHYPDVWYNLESALEAALKHGDIQLAERFIEYGSNWPTSDNLPHEIAALGNLPVLQWLLKQAEFENVAGLVVKAAGKGHLQVVRWLLHCRVRSSDEVRFAIHSAAVHGHLEVAKFLREKEKESLTTQLSSEDPLSPSQFGTSSAAMLVSARTMVGAARNGHLDVIQWLYSEYGADSATDLFDLKKKNKNRTTAMDAAAGNGHLDVLQYLHELEISTLLSDNSRKRKRSKRQTGLACTKRAMDDAAGNGFLNVVQWLHENRQEGCSTGAMDASATGGHLEMVKWLHNERSEGCTSAAMVGAARNGHLKVIQWLHSNVNAGCTTEAMDGAAASGHLDVVKWLHFNRSEGCMTKAMDSAAARGSLDIVKWLHRNRAEGCTTAAMDKAVEGRHLRVAQWLHSHRLEGCSSSALDAAADHAYFDGFLFLHSQCKIKCTEKTALLTHNHGTPEIHAWILENYPEFRAVVDNSEDGEDE
ncbi:hypothetical protein PC128_g14169 [Phytophthora cactorum]|nr:hypothetical protein PC122_g19066 [Phytophthora cactorum]KAG3136953.1 hypothetical protein C6341_g21193 [Phytophthora cactorum]KAG3183491.1 hypothetical protein PC128_g14169 [Phytophthora cactorum]